MATTWGSGSTYRRTPGSAGTLGGTVKKDAINVIGLNELRKGLKAINRETGNEINRFLRKHAVVVRDRARANSPYVSGELRKSIKHYVRAKNMGLWSRSEYAKAHEWGTSRSANSQVQPRGVPIRIKRSQMLGEAVFHYREQTEEQLTLLLLHLAQENGFDD